MMTRKRNSARYGFMLAVLLMAAFAAACSGTDSVAPSNGSGSLDTGFNTTGIVTTPVSTRGSFANGMTIQPNGKIVAAGGVYSGKKYDFAVARYSADGTLDPTFNTTGMVTTPTGTQDNVAYAVAYQPADGKIVAAGYANKSGSPNFALVRYWSDGTLDNSFGTAGMLVTSGTGSTVNAVAIQPDGKIVAAGYGYSSATFSNAFAVARYNTDGTLDTTFNTTGKVITAIGGFMASAYAYGLAIQPDGKIVAAGYGSNANSFIFMLVRYNADGTLDSSFGTGGKVTTPIGTSNSIAYAVALQPNGKIVAAGLSSNGSDNDFELLRYNADGSLDTTFNKTGMVTTAFGAGTDDVPYAVALQTDGKIVAAGSSRQSGKNNFAMARYNADGSLDTTFNTTGMLTTPIGAGNDYINAVAIQSDGKIAAAGSSDQGSNGWTFALARYWP